jgi:Tol biopolymer transport system component
MNADGTSQTRLTNLTHEGGRADAPKASWSLDGTMIALTSFNEDNKIQTWVMHADGTGRMRLTDGRDAFYN